MFFVPSPVQHDDGTRTQTSARRSDREDETIAAGERPPRREWLVTNGLGGYASGTVAGMLTRRYHGMLVASLPAPLGRIVMLNHLLERVRLPDTEVIWLGDEDEVAGPNAADRTEHLAEFRLELGLPVWRYRDRRLHDREAHPDAATPEHRARHLPGAARATARCGFKLRPSVHYRGYEASVDETPMQSYTIAATGNRYELSAGPDLPVLRMHAARRARGADARREGRAGRSVPDGGDARLPVAGIAVEPGLLPRRRCAPDSRCR